MAITLKKSQPAPAVTGLPQITLSATSVPDAAQRYWDNGLTAIPRHLGKNGYTPVSWKGGKQVNRDEALSHFDDNMNIELLCGPQSGGLVDVDLDSDIACRLAPAFLPQTDCVFGRAKRPSSHRLYRVDAPLGKQSFRRTQSGKDGYHLELRTDNCIVCVPPSVHTKDGQTVRFESGKDGLPSMVDGATLNMAVRYLAVACILAEAWPKQSGNRHNLALAIAGGLLRGGVSKDDATTILHQASKTAGDDEPEDRANAVQDTAKSLASKADVTGWPTAVEIIGTEPVNLILSWLSISDAAENPLLGLVRTAKQIIQMPDSKPKQLVRPWLSEGSITLVYARAKAGKSWFTYELANSLASQSCFLDYSVMQNQKVLYLDGEMQLPHTKERLEKLVSNHDGLMVLNGDDIRAACSSSLNLTHEQDQNRVGQVIKEHGAKVLFIDTMSALAPRKDENDNMSSELQSLFHWLFRLRSGGITVVMVHHTGHAEGHPRGASMLQAWVDNLISLKQVPNTDLMEMEFVHTRGPKPDPSARRYRMLDCGEVITFDPVEDKKSNPPEYALLPHLLSGKGITVKKLASAIGKGTTQTHTYVGKLRDSGLLSGKKYALSTKGKKLAQSLTELSGQKIQY